MSPADPCPACGMSAKQNARQHDALVAKEEAVMSLGKELARVRKQLRELTKQQADRRVKGEYGDEAQEVFDYWNENVKKGKAREFTDDRFNKVVARLKAGHTVEDIKLAVDGMALKPYVTDSGRASNGKADERHDDLTLICRSESHLNRFAAYAEAHRTDEGQPAQEDRVEDENERVLRGYQSKMYPETVLRLHDLRGWTAEAIATLGLGIDGDRVVFPVRDSKGVLVGWVRYQPNPERRHGPKSIAEGPRELFPRPEMYEAGTVWLVEGESDAVAARSIGLPAVAVPGVATWKAGWPHRFERFERVVICFDCDPQGREAADARARSLKTVTRVTVVDLYPKRDTGYDLGDVVKEKGGQALNYLLGLAKTQSSSVLPMPKLADVDPYDHVVNALEAKGQKVAGSRSGTAYSTCPAHEDRHASLSIGRGEDGRVLLRCHAGCDTEAVLGALGLSWSDVFPEAA